MQGGVPARILLPGRIGSHHSDLPSRLSFGDRRHCATVGPPGGGLWTVLQRTNAAVGLLWWRTVDCTIETSAAVGPPGGGLWTVL